MAMGQAILLPEYMYAKPKIPPSIASIKAFAPSTVGNN